MTCRLPSQAAFGSPCAGLRTCQPSQPAPFQCGDRIRAIVRLLPPEIYHDPGVWSREDFLLDQGITSTRNPERRPRGTPRPHRRRAHSPGLPHRRSAARHHADACWPCPRPCAACPRPCASPPTTPSCWPPWSPATAPTSRTLCASALSAPAPSTCWWSPDSISPLWPDASSGLRAACACRASRHAPHYRRLLCLCALHGLRHAGPAFAVDGHPLPARPPHLSRTQPHEHHRLCRVCACSPSIPAACSTQACR